MDASSTPGAAEPEVDPALAAVAAALADISGRGSTDSSADLRAQLRLLEQVTRRVEAAVIGVVADCERTAAFFDDGHVSVRNWAAAETNTSAASALARARAARLANACPQVAAALASGHVGASQVYEMGRARANPRVGHLLDDVVDELLAEAAVMPLPGFLALVRQWEALVDQDGAQCDHDAAHAARQLRTSHRDDEPGGELRARFGAEQFSEVTEILDAYADAELTADVAAARAEGDDSPLPRSGDQRRADALVQALRDAAGSKRPARDSVPTVNYLIPADVLEEQIAAMVESRAPDFDTRSLRWRLCATTSGVPVDPAAVVAAALVGHVRRIVVGSSGRIIGVGRRQRIFTGAAREAALIQSLLDVSDGRCLWPGCGRRRNCQIDHTTEWQHDGVTDLANAGLLCARHNRHKSHGYTVWRDPAGRWHTYRPDGTELGSIAA